ncbi:MAG: FAD synthase [Parcubacteria group bacterium]|nr:FAD synthase [Parcubacteria group bacterium]|tara:strand:- start:2292 stop:2684 length:393 start_codon:yes stop_codon:yes gene_type:complete
MKQVMVFGTFDFIHPGHLNFFKQAKKYGDKLTVVVARDTTAKKIKKKLPMNSEKDRQQLVAELKIVNQAVLGDKVDQMKVVRRLKPNVVCLGYDQKAFVNLLESDFPQIKLVRLKAYKSRFYKSSQLKKL